MATPRTWLPRADEIKNILQGMNTSLLDRNAIEHLFEIQRRSAILLMQEVGPIKQGGSFRVERQKLIAWVQKIAEEGAGELRRRQAQFEELSRGLSEAQAMRYMLREEGRPPVPFPIVAEVLHASFNSLTPEISIEPGKICIQFAADDPEVACQLLYELSKALANDFNGFLRTQFTKDAHGKQRPSTQTNPAGSQEV